MRVIQREVASAFIFSADDQLLLGKNRNGGAYTGMWVIPGGGLEDDETPSEAVVREVLQETRIDISNADIEYIEEPLFGESEKRLRDTDELVLMKMKFHDFIVRLPIVASEVKFSARDDLVEAQFWMPEQLSDIPLSPGVQNRLQLLGYLSVD